MATAMDDKDLKNSNTIVKETPKDEGAKASDAEVLKKEVQEPEVKKEEVKKEEVKKEEVVVKKEEVVEDGDDAAGRKERLAKRIDRVLSKSKAAPVEETKREVATDEAIKKLIQDGKTEEAIKLAEERAVQRSSSKVRTELSQEQQLQEFRTVRENANRKVWEKYPDVLDVDEGVKKADDVPMAKVLGEIYTEKPHLMYLPDGPEIAMEMAERRLGIVEGVKKSKEEGRKQEAERVERTTAAASVISSSSGSGAPAKASTEINLDPDEKLVARKLGLTEEEYAQNKTKGSIHGAEYYSKFRNVKRKS